MSKEKFIVPLPGDLKDDRSDQEKNPANNFVLPDTVRGNTEKELKDCMTSVIGEADEEQTEILQGPQDCPSKIPRPV